MTAKGELVVSENESSAMVPATEAATILQIIERAASNPDVDIDKMERLLQMQERIVQRDAEAAFNSAMRDCQAEMRPVSADAENPQTHSKYASHGKLDKALRPIYTKHGFALSYDEGESPKTDHVRVLCYVSHTGGHSRTYHRDMPADGKGAKGGDVMTKTHAAGAAGSYGARYLLKGIFNVAIGEDDNDGNGAGAKNKTITATQLLDLLAKIEEVGADKEAFKKFLKVDNFVDLLASKYDQAIKALTDKAKGARK